MDQVGFTSICSEIQVRLSQPTVGLPYIKFRTCPKFMLNSVSVKDLKKKDSDVRNFRINLRDTSAILAKYFIVL